MQILIFGGSPDELKILEHSLQQSFTGLSIYKITAGQNIIEKSHEYQPDIIILYYQNLPTDFEICKTLKSDSRLNQIPLIVITNQPVDDETGEKMIHAGVSGYLSEPLQNSELKVLITGILQTAKNSGRKNLGQLRKAYLIDTKNRQTKIKEQQYRTMIEKSPIAITLAEKGFKCIYTNPALCNFLGRTKDEIVGHSLYDFMVNNEKKTAIKSFIKHGKKETDTSIFNVQFIRKQGEIRYAELDVAKYKNSRNKIITVGQIIDITDQKQAEEKFRIVFQSAPDAYLISNPEGVFIDCNNAAEKLTGFAKEEIIGRKLWDINLIKENDYNGLKKNMAGNSREKSSEPGEITLIRKNGETIETEIATHPVKIDNQVLVLIIARNITQRKQYERELITAKEKAQESDRLKAAFLANIGHEIRTPMNGIFGFMELMKNTQLTKDEYQLFFNLLKKSGERLLKTITDIIEISKIESGRVVIKKTTFNLNESMVNLLHIFKPETEIKNLDLRLSLETGEDYNISTDRNKFDHILSNLIKNAIKFTSAGFVEIGNMFKNNELVFYVKDTGLGIRAEKQETIFERFMQADVTLTRPYEGSGLGLSIAKAYTSALDGRIWVESKPGTGSTFFFTLRKPE